MTERCALRGARGVVLLAFASGAWAQTAQQQSMSLGRDEIATFARVQVAVTVAHDSIDAKLARAGNKVPKFQRALQDSLRMQIAEILHHAGMSDGEYRRRTYLVSTDTVARRVFDSVVVVITGAPLPGQVARGPQLPVPAGPAGVHLGHIVNGFNDTPNLQGLLPTALGEARVAAAHATLAGRQPANLDYMKTHAGHVINALDPALVSAGPGLGYGLIKAMTNVARHNELAVTSDGAPQSVKTHAPHVAIATANTTRRSQQLLALAQKVQTAASAEEAAALVSQMAALADQLMAGEDANKDGRVTPDEGGLALVEEHLKLMLGTGK